MTQEQYERIEKVESTGSNHFRRPHRRRADLRLGVLPLLRGDKIRRDAAENGCHAGATNSAASKAGAPDAKPAVAKRQLTGAELYSMHCNRCHPERYPTERTAAQWKTIMLHMQVRANIPVDQSKLILKYLQENSGR